jgi:hypothetical protein
MRCGQVLHLAATLLASAGCGGSAHLAGSADGSTVPDGSTEIADGNALDGQEPEAAPYADSSVDAETRKGWCATQGYGVFCEDFYSGVPDQLTGALTNGATLAADTMIYESPPQSMVAVIPNLTDSGVSASALGTYAFSNDKLTDFLLKAYFRLDSSCFTGDPDAVIVAQLVFAKLGYTIELGASASAVVLRELGAPSDGGAPQVVPHSFATMIPLDTWALWSLHVNGLAGSVDVTVGSLSTFHEERLAIPAADGLLLLAPTLGLGASAQNVQGQSSGCRVHIDDITFAIQQDFATN